ncbi:unnamed protein product [Acanthocheilonema viteae]|uniref:Uncharacterized protein n=1 Tax=Acanthocheilonema viteae TaxID=6277 RepID=A0A498S7T0_ACAVI|nr:unnamed protein product [Acanthocheilonema viteae]
MPKCHLAGTTNLGSSIALSSVKFRLGKKELRSVIYLVTGEKTWGIDAGSPTDDNRNVDNSSDKDYGSGNNIDNSSYSSYDNDPNDNDNDSSSGNNDMTILIRMAVVITVMVIADNRSSSGDDDNSSCSDDEDDNNNKDDDKLRWKNRMTGKKRKTNRSSTV